MTNHPGNLSGGLLLHQPSQLFHTILPGLELSPFEPPIDQLFEEPCFDTSASFWAAEVGISSSSSSSGGGIGGEDDWPQHVLAPDFTDQSLLSSVLNDLIANDGPLIPDMAATSQVPLFTSPSTTSHDNFLLGNLNFQYPPGPADHTPSTTYHTPSTTAAPSHPRGSPTGSSDGHLASGMKRKAGGAGGRDGEHPDPDSEEAQAAVKRQRNTLAARKYRQKRLDRISELEKALEDMTGERDSLKLQLARREAEVEALREMLGRK